jgi:hypothetical protein
MNHKPPPRSHTVSGPSDRIRHERHSSKSTPVAPKAARRGSAARQDKAHKPSEMSTPAAGGCVPPSGAPPRAPGALRRRRGPPPHLSCVDSAARNGARPRKRARERAVTAGQWARRAARCSAARWSKGTCRGGAGRPVAAASSKEFAAHLNPESCRARALAARARHKNRKAAAEGGQRTCRLVRWRPVAFRYMCASVLNLPGVLAEFPCLCVQRWRSGCAGKEKEPQPPHRRRCCERRQLGESAASRCFFDSWRTSRRFWRSNDVAYRRDRLSLLKPDILDAQQVVSLHLNTMTTLQLFRGDTVQIKV